jgi:CheY-like chemotaxis protein
MLEELSVGFKTVSNGKEVLDELPNDKYDIIFMDIEMPVMNGLEATRKIRALEDPVISKIPIVAMTANAFESDIQATKEAGMNAHVTKPFVKDDLISKIDANL